MGRRCDIPLMRAPFPLGRRFAAFFPMLNTLADPLLGMMNFLPKS